MSHITCPLCGKNAPLSTFDPELLELDIFAVSFKGLGRARGFEVAERYSMLGDDDVTPKVLNRVIDLCRFFVEKDIIDSISLSNRIGLTDDVITSTGFNRLNQENATLRKQLNVNEARVEELEEKESELANIEERLEAIVDLIEEYTDYIYDSSEENRIDFIEETVQKLLEDIEALRSEQDE